MPRISEFYGITIYMYWRDHPPPHFRAIYAGHDAAVSIASGDVQDGHIPRRAAKMVREWAAQHTEELADNWQRSQRGEPLLPIEPLE